MKILGEDTDKMNSPKRKKQLAAAARFNPGSKSSTAEREHLLTRGPQRRPLPATTTPPLGVVILYLFQLLSPSPLPSFCTHVVVPLHEPLVHPAEEAIHGLLVRGEGVSPHLRGAEGRGGGGGEVAESARERARGGRWSGGGRRDEKFYSVKFG